MRGILQHLPTLELGHYIPWQAVCFKRNLSIFKSLVKIGKYGLMMTSPKWPKLTKVKIHHSVLTVVEFHCSS